LVGEALLHIPVVVRGVAKVELRWDSFSKTLLSRKKELEQIEDTWRQYLQTQNDLQELYSNIQEKVSSLDPDAPSVDLSNLQNQQEVLQVSHGYSIV